MDNSIYIEKLKDYLPEKRIRHSMGVAKAAVRLSEIYGCDKEKANLAGILHDCAKYVKFADVNSYCEKYGIELDEFEKNSTALSHSVLGYYIVKNEFGVDDEDVLMAIRSHTTGRPNMSKLEEVVFLADMIEEGRDFEGVEELRELSYSGNLEEAILKSLENTISVVMKKKAPIHLRTVQARNYYLGKVKQLKKENKEYL